MLAIATKLSILHTAGVLATLLNSQSINSYIESVSSAPQWENQLVDLSRRIQSSNEVKSKHSIFNKQDRYVAVNSVVVEANHLVYIVPRCYQSRIYVDCQQKLFSSEDDSGGRILQVTFLKEQKREYDAEIIIFDTKLVFLCWCSLYFIIKVYPKLYLVCEFKLLFTSLYVFAWAFSVSTSIFNKTGLGFSWPSALFPQPSPPLLKK